VLRYPVTFPSYTYIVLGRPLLELLDQLAFPFSHGSTPVAQATFTTRQIDDGGLH
jgi:hypothetical protein